MAPHPSLPFLVGLLGLASVALRSLALRRVGINPWVLPAGGDLPGFLGRSFLALIVLYPAILLLWAAAPGWSLATFGDIPPFGSPAVGWAGLLLMTLGVALMAAGQFGMGRSWRVGIPEGETPALVTSGLFAWSRNPVFLGMLLAAGGVMLAVPHVLAAMSMVATFMALSVQVRLEEAHLIRVLGPSYAAYTVEVGRWFGRGNGIEVG